MSRKNTIELPADRYAALQARNTAARAKPASGDRQVSTKAQKRRQRDPGQPKAIYLTLPYPPSVNHYWLPNFNHSKRISDKGNQFRAEVIHACRGHDGIMGRVSVSVIANPPDKRKRDLDNIFKALLDALRHAGMIEDDSLIDRLLIERGKVFEFGQVRVTIEPLTP